MSSVVRSLEILLNKSGLSMYMLSKKLGIGSSNIWLYMHKKRSPSIPTCRKIIKFAKEYGLEWTLDTVKGNEDE